MSTNKETQERQALNIYCQLTDIENVLDVMTFAFRAEEELLEKNSKICWGSIISILKKEVTEVRNLAENLEQDIRTTSKNDEQQAHSNLADDFVVLPVGVVLV